MIPEQAKGSEGHTRQQLEARITLPHHTIFLQYFPLYILPIVIAVIARFVIRLLAAGRRGLNHERAPSGAPERYDASGCNSASTARCAATRCWPPNRLLRLSR